MWQQRKKKCVTVCLRVLSSCKRLAAFQADGKEDSIGHCSFTPITAEWVMRTPASGLNFQHYSLAVECSTA